MAVNYEKNQSKPKVFILTLTLFVLVLILNISLFFVNKVSSSTIEEQRLVNQELNQRLETEKQDGYYVVYTKKLSSQSHIDKYEKLSQISEFVGNISSLSREYGILFEDFRYQNGNIKTSGLVLSDDKNSSYEKLSKFVEYFRNENNHIFDLAFLNSVKGEKNLEFVGEFLVK